jgi:hypothetical protein
MFIGGAVRNGEQLPAEQLHQLARRIEREVESLPKGRALRVSVPGKQCERFHSLLSPATRKRVVVVPSEGFEVTCGAVKGGGGPRKKPLALVHDETAALASENVVMP